MTLTAIQTLQSTQQPAIERAAPPPRYRGNITVAKRTRRAETKSRTNAAGNKGTFAWANLAIGI